jgi:hypothetical protein
LPSVTVLSSTVILFINIANFICIVIAVSV